MAAQLLVRHKYVYADGVIRKMVIRQLPHPGDERPHRLKYRLYHGYPGTPLVRYDNERGKGGHRHEGKHQARYTFISVEQLIRAFEADIERSRGEHEE
jgi:hypothetical protein